MKVQISCGETSVQNQQQTNQQPLLLTLMNRYYLELNVLLTAECQEYPELYKYSAMEIYPHDAAYLMPHI